MTDRELELAAKAGGIESDGAGGYYDSERKEFWDASQDDGQALRLLAVIGDTLTGNELLKIGDAIATTSLPMLRRAIVRAAALSSKEG